MTSLQQTAMLGGAASAKVASYILTAADAGTAVSMSNAGATTITVNTGLFAAGDTVQITNLGAGVCTITAGTATVNSSASLALAQYESGTLDFISSSAAIFIKGAGGAAASGGMTLLTTLTLSGSSVTSSTFSSAYKQLFVYIKGAYASGVAQMRIQFNGDTGSNYSWGVLENGSPDRNASTTFIRFSNIGTSSAPKTAGYGFLTIMNPSDTDVVYFTGVTQFEQSGTLTFFRSTGVYDNTSVITSLTLSLDAGNFSGGSALIYGVN